MAKPKHSRDYYMRKLITAQVQMEAYSELLKHLQNKVSDLGAVVDVIKADYEKDYPGELSK